jgi:sigma-B regulation protein RsbU (phosphoserine phosphatase)
VLLGPDGSPPRLLDSEGPLIGAVEGLEFTADVAEVPPGGRLFVFSDGAFEVGLAEGGMWPFAAFLEQLTAAPAGADPRMDALVTHIRRISGREDFQDDFSMLELRFE